MTMKSVALAASTLILGTAAAHAGGYVPPVVETAPGPVVIETPVGSWQGGYAGLTLGYAFSGKDRVGLTDSDTGYLGDIGELKLNGGNAGIRLGYRWQRGNWVFGPEIGYEGGSVKDETNADVIGTIYEDSNFKAESKIKSMVALRMKTGYTVTPDTLVYGIVGVGRADVDYEMTQSPLDGSGSASLTDNYTKTGYILGLGVEKQINEKWSVTGEYEYANFGKESLQFGDLTTEATAKYNNVKLGVNFRF